MKIDAKSSRPAVILCAALLAATSYAAEDHAADNTAVGVAPGKIRAYVGFGAAINDAEVTSAITRHGVRSTAVFTSVAGLTGSHRSYRQVEPETLVREARADSIEFFKRSLRGLSRRMEEFTAIHSEEEIAADQTLQTQARSLLNLREKLETALSAAAGGRPLVYGADIEGSSAQLNAMRASGTAAAYVLVAPESAKSTSMGSIKPLDYDSAYEDPKVRDAPVGELHSLMRKAITIDEAFRDAPGRD